MDIFNNLPIYEVRITSEEDGIEYVALTARPAIEANFLAFNDSLKFSLNEDKRLITGPLMICDMPIFRRDKNKGEFYVVYKADTIRLMAEKMLFDKRTTAVNIEHIENSEVPGVILEELYIKDSSRGINPIEFSEVPDGSLFATYKVENDVIWNSIKAGKFKGFSLEGDFSLVRESDEYEDLLKMLKRIKKVK